MKTLKQQVGDALWYLKKPNKTNEDDAKAIEILSDIAFGAGDPDSIVNDIEVAKPSVLTGAMKKLLKGKQIAVIPGHQKRNEYSKHVGGAPGERAYNLKVAKKMIEILEDAGADVYFHDHLRVPYSMRQNEMKAAVKKAHPKSFVCIELHYDHVSYPSAHGYAYFYVSNNGKILASAIRDEIKLRFPHLTARGDKNNGVKTGIQKQSSGNGSGFLKKAPGVAVLTEPFFRSNPAEWEFFKDRYDELAEIYCIGIAEYARKKAGA